jgi:hypothetical protein
MIAACLIARSQQVYSPGTVSSHFISETDCTDVEFCILRIGPLTIDESEYWTDANGNKLYGPHTAGAPVQRSMNLFLGHSGIIVPFPKKHTVIIGAATLFILSAIFGGILLKKQRGRITGETSN